MYFIKQKKNETFIQHLGSKSKWTFNKTSVHFGGLGWGEGGGTVVQTLGTLKSNNADDNDNVKKKQNNRFYMQNNNFARASRLFVHFFCPFLYDYNVKMPNFAFYGVSKQATTKFISLSELECGP